MAIHSKNFFVGCFIGVVLLFAVLFTLPNGKLTLVFCNVGQGDAAYIRTPSNQDMLIDGGPNKRVIECLGRHMPFYDRTIDVVVLTHPQQDHLGGLLDVIQRYKVNYFVIGVEGNNSEGYRKLVDLLQEKNIPVKNMFTGDKFSFGNTNIDVLWPKREWVASKIQNQSWAVLGLSTDEDVNNFSYFLKLSYGSFDALFPGDGDNRIQPEIMKDVQLPDVEVLKFPHHGSKYGATEAFLDIVKPELAVISVGKNSYGHPSDASIRQLEKRNIAIKRTDLEGDIEIVSDGTGWWVVKK